MGEPAERYRVSVDFEDYKTDDKMIKEDWYMIADKNRLSFTFDTANLDQAEELFNHLKNIMNEKTREKTQDETDHSKV